MNPDALQQSEFDKLKSSLGHETQEESTPGLTEEQWRTFLRVRDEHGGALGNYVKTYMPDLPYQKAINICALRCVDLDLDSFTGQYGAVNAVKAAIQRPEEVAAKERADIEALWQEVNSNG